MFDAIFYAVMVASMVASAAAGYVANEKAKEAKEAEERTVYAFEDASDITTSADAELPEIVVVTD